MNELKIGEKVARNVTIATLALAIGKLAAAYITGSLAITADAFHSFSDLIPIFAAWIGLKIASRPRDERFPFGYYKAESIAAFLASLFILLLAYEIFTESLTRLFLPYEITHGGLGLALVFISIVVSGILAKYQFDAARRVNSQALLVNARETVMDVLSSCLVFIGVVFTMLGYPWVDGLVGLGLALFVAYSGVVSLKESVLALMDASVPKDEVNRIKSVVERMPRIRKVKSIWIRRSGPFLMSEMVIAVPSNIDVKLADRIAAEIEEKVKGEGIDHVIIHVEPPEKKEILLAVPIDKNGKPSSVFGSAPMFAIYKVRGKRKKLVKKMRNPGFGLKKKRGVKAALALVDLGVDVVKVKKIGDDSREILERAGVKVVID